MEAKGLCLVLGGVLDDDLVEGGVHRLAPSAAVDAALNDGGTDNITAMFVTFEGGGRR